MYDGARMNWQRDWGIYSEHGICPECPRGDYHARMATRRGNTVHFQCYWGLPDKHAWSVDIPKGHADWQDTDRTYLPEEQQLDVRIDGMAERREAA